MEDLFGEDNDTGHAPKLIEESKFKINFSSLFSIIFLIMGITFYQHKYFEYNIVIFEIFHFLYQEIITFIY